MARTQPHSAGAGIAEVRRGSALAEARAQLDQWTGSEPRAGMLWLGRALGEPWRFVRLEPCASGDRRRGAGRLPEPGTRPDAVVLRVRDLGRDRLAAATGAGGATAPVTFARATN